MESSQNLNPAEDSELKICCRMARVLFSYNVGVSMTYKRVIIRDFGSPEVLQVIEEPQLPEPMPGEIRVKVLAASASYTDTMIRKGAYPDVKQKPPFSPGYDMVGVVDKLGKGTSKFKVGDRVCDLTVIGSYSDYLCVPEDRLVPVPESVDAGEAVSLILSYVTAYQMLYRFGSRIKYIRRVKSEGVHV